MTLKDLQVRHSFCEKVRPYQPPVFLPSFSIGCEDIISKKGFLIIVKAFSLAVFAELARENCFDIFRIHREDTPQPSKGYFCGSTVSSATELVCPNV
jgi:hypothetical protein